MASNSEIAKSLTEQLQRKGFECGQRYTSLGDQLPELEKKFPEETATTLRTKAELIVEEKAFGFKIRRSNGFLEISARASGPVCGT